MLSPDAITIKQLLLIFCIIDTRTLLGTLIHPYVPLPVEQCKNIAEPNPGVHEVL